MTSAERWRAMVFDFPSLDRKLRGVDLPADFDAEAIDKVTASGAGWSSGERLALQFVLFVWSGPGADWEVGPFDLHRAMNVWDDEHLAVFAAWARTPFFP